MSLLTLLALAAALGTDAFSLCVGVGLAGVNRLCKGAVLFAGAWRCPGCSAGAPGRARVPRQAAPGEGSGGVKRARGTVLLVVSTPCAGEGGQFYSTWRRAFARFPPILLLLFLLPLLYW
jgi:hypothetical protein